MLLKKRTRIRIILRRTPKSRQYLVKLPESNTTKEEGWDRCSTGEAS